LEFQKHTGPAPGRKSSSDLNWAFVTQCATGLGLKAKEGSRGRRSRPTILLSPIPKATDGGARRKSRLWREEQRLRTRPRNPPKRL